MCAGTSNVTIPRLSSDDILVAGIFFKLSFQLNMSGVIPKGIVYVLKHNATCWMNMTIQA